MSADVINSQNLSNSKRALFIMGYLCRWYDFDDPKILKEHGFEMNAAFEPLTSVSLKHISLSCLTRHSRGKRSIMYMNCI